jgi:hypothetical protein
VRGRRRSWSLSRCLIIPAFFSRKAAKYFGQHSRVPVETLTGHLPHTILQHKFASGSVVILSISKRRTSSNTQPFSPRKSVSTHNYLPVQISAEKPISLSVFRDFPQYVQENAGTFT